MSLSALRSPTRPAPTSPSVTWRFPLKDIPAHQTVHSFILQHSDLTERARALRPRFERSWLSAPLTLSDRVLLADARAAIASSGLFQTQLRGQQASTLPSYQSVSMTWNPQAIDAPGADPHQATLGSTTIAHGSALAVDRSSLAARNTYADSYAFRERTPASKVGLLGEFLDSLPATLIRSRLSVVHAGRSEEDLRYNWHNDEDVFLSLRINVPLLTDPTHTLQLLHLDAETNRSRLEEQHLEAGRAHVYDTGQFHRPCVRRFPSSERIVLIAAIAPWFHFDVASASWVSNEYYGKLHPFELLAEGLLGPYIGRAS